MRDRNRSLSCEREQIAINELHKPTLTVRLTFPYKIYYTGSLTEKDHATAVCS
jgi:hypothetical protein